MDEELKKMLEQAKANGAADSDLHKIINLYEKDSSLKKKGSSVSATRQTQAQNTMGLPSEDGSSGMVSQRVKEKQAELKKRALDKYEEDNAAPYSSPLGKAYAGTVAVLGEMNKSVYQFADDLIVASRKGLQEEGFFDDDIPDTDTPITDAIKNKELAKNQNKVIGTPVIDVAGTAKLALKIINSALPQSAKNKVISALNYVDAGLKNKIKEVEEVQEYALPKDNIAVNVTKGIVGMAPDLLAASVMKNPAAVEGRFTRVATEVSKDAKPLIKKYVPKAAKFIEESVRAPFTKIMAAKGTASGIANAEEGEDIVDAGIEGGIKGGLEGVYMHTLGVFAGKAMPAIAKQISRTGMNSKFATAIANPLANAGVFTTARALRTPIETGELATGRELAEEAGMGVGFSLLHAGSLYKNQNEANHYYDNTLKTDPLESFGRVINETKGNLELVYNPDLTPSQVIELESARNELRDAIIKEPDLNNKKLLGDEALKIQNQLDAHSAVKGIVENKDAIIEAINSNENLSEEVKSEKTKKVAAIADFFDTSEFGVKKKELDTKIDEAQKRLDDAALGFTNLTKASDRKLAKIEIEKRRAELEGLNKELDDLIDNKYAIQEPKTDESVLRAEQPELELQGVGEGNAKPEVFTEEQTIINAKPEEVVEPSMPIKDAVADEVGVYYYNGEKGQVNLDGQTVVFETKDKLFDLGNVEELSENTLEDFGISKEQELQLKLNEDNTIELNGKKYVNNYSDPESAFGTDKEGNYTVTLETENGQKRTFRGQQADQIVYETRLKNFEENGTEQQIEQAHAAADEAIRIETEIGETAPKRKGKSVRKGKQRTLKTVKEPLNKAERAAQEKQKMTEETNYLSNKNQLSKVESSPTLSIELGKLKEPKESINDFYERYLNAKADGSNPELVSSVDKLLAIEISPFEGMLKPGTEVVYNGSKGWIKEVNNFAGAKEYSIVSDSPKGPSSKWVSVEEFNKNGKAVEESAPKYENPKPKEEVKPAEPKAEAKADTENERKDKVPAVWEGVDEKGNKVWHTYDPVEGDTFYSDTKEEAMKNWESVWDNSTKAEREQMWMDDSTESNLAPIIEKTTAPISKVEPKTEPTEPKVSKEIEKIDKEIAQLEGDSNYYESKIEEIQDEIATEQSNTKEGLVELKEKVKKEIEEVKKDKSLGKFEKIDKIEEIKYEIENFKEEQQDLIDSYKDDLSEAKLEYKKTLKKINKLYEKKRNAIAEEPKTKPTWEEIPKGERTLDDIKERIRDVKEKNKEILGANMKELLKLNPKEEGTLKKVSDYLDRLDKSLDINPNELNDITRVMTVGTAKAVIKTLKALVDAGITLQEAIKMASAAHKVKEEQIVEVLDIVSKINENKSEGISEFELKGYNKFSKVVDSAISNGKTIDNVLNYMNRSEVYKIASDVQKELLVRDVRKRFGLREKSAPSVAKLFGKLKDVTKITMDEMKLIHNDIKMQNLGAKQVIETLNKKKAELAEATDELVRQGKITTQQASNVVKRFAKVNLLSETSVGRFTEYMAKVFNKADYAKKLKKSKKFKKSISKLSKNKDKNVNLTELGKKFAKIDPSMVENIDEYNAIAADVKKAIIGSTKRLEKINWQGTVKIEEVSKYIDKTIEAQDLKLREEKIAELQDLLGVDAKDFSAEEIDELLKTDKKISKDNSAIAKATIEKGFDIYSTMIKEAIETGKDPFTGEDVSYKPNDIEVVKQFMDMDLSRLTDKQALAAADALHNFLVNKSTANMENVLRQYIGPINAKEFLTTGGKKGTGRVAKELRKYFSKNLGNFLTRKGTPMGGVFTKLFKGVEAGSEFARLSGFSEIQKGKNYALTAVKNISTDYIKQFFDKKANGEKFNTAYNEAERGIVADLRRATPGNEAAEFKRRVGILDQSIKELENGTPEEVKKAELYQRVYDKVVEGSKDLSDVESKTDKLNLKAIEFWQKQHELYFDDLANYMLNVHNTILEKGVNYASPDRYAKLTEETPAKLLDNEAMYGAGGEHLYKKEASGLMKAEYPEDLPQGRYRDYSFDKNNVNSVRDALVDMNTGGAIRQLESFRESPEYKKIIPSVYDRNMVNKRLTDYVANTRNKGDYGVEDSKLIKVLDKTATIGAGMVLGSPLQAIKQTIPIIPNTVINAGKLGFTGAFDPNFNNFLNESGYATGLRGVESQLEISSLNKKIELAAEGTPAQLAKAIENANKWWLKTFLVKPDVFIARSSWQAYYEQSLERQGISTKGIDYSDHKINEKAGDYAEEMVSRQQNVSDQDLAGEWFTKNTPDAKILKKIFLNMAAFRMNQSARLGADLTTLEYWNTSTTADKVTAARSLAGYGAEMITFRILSAAAILGLGSLAKKIKGEDESDKDWEKRYNNVLKGQLTSSVVDTFSPAPFLDMGVKAALSPASEKLEEVTGLPLSIYGVQKEDWLRQLGAYGMAPQRLYEVEQAAELGFTGTYTDDFGKEKKISEENQETIRELLPFYAAAGLGILPADAATVMRNIVKYSKKGGGGGMSEEQLKKSNPKLYEKLYGKNSLQNRIKERKNKSK